jgi:hypothetical protein
MKVYQLPCREMAPKGNANRGNELETMLTQGSTGRAHGTLQGTATRKRSVIKVDASPVKVFDKGDFARRQARLHLTLQELCSANRYGPDLTASS